jgi:hypothetical protein
MIKSCSITKAVFLECRMNLECGAQSHSAGEKSRHAMHSPFDNFRCDDTLFRIQETVGWIRDK